MNLDGAMEMESTAEEGQQYCPFCMRPLPLDVVQCPFCGSVARMDFPISTFLAIAGTTGTIASFLTLMGGFFGVIIALSFRVPLTGVLARDDPQVFQLFVLLALSNFIGFVAGSIVATNTSGKRGFSSAVMASILLLLIGGLNLTVLSYRLDYRFFWSFAFGFLVILLAFFSLILLTVRKREFKQGFKRGRPEHKQKGLVR